MDLRGKRFLVTGATGGIGGALAATLRDRGARVVVHGRSPARLACQPGVRRLTPLSPALVAAEDTASRVRMPIGLPTIGRVAFCAAAYWHRACSRE